ncbi:MAG: Fe-S cluster assembly protein SufB [Candidatus Cloacimonadota bacterium]|nr:MAG: Fe-S cluster assembly protein SufB [Candidatus Cloacimonadota bacterium]PIE81381.1 MAG: Fe-S cluster assembly protein SufB [Candidatus Delongbacteria bacterium]
MSDKDIKNYIDREYEHGFVTDTDQEVAPKGLDENTIRMISQNKEEPEWMLEFRLKAFENWKKMKEPEWANFNYQKIDYQDIHYYAAPKKKFESLDDVSPEILETYEKLGIPLHEQKALAGVEEKKPIAVDAIFDSVSVATTFKKQLLDAGVIFCSISEAMKDYPELVKKYMGTVVPPSDNFFAALNSAVFTDGSFVFIPKGVKSPMDLSSYFRINTQDSGQFERTLIVAEEGAYASYLEGCTAPRFDTNQLHAAVVEIVVLDDAEIKYSTVQNWYAGDPETGKGGIYNFVTKRAKCLGKNSKVSWTQVETGSAITWKYPSCVLLGDNSIGEFFSVALTTNHQLADTGSKMIHVGKNTKSSIISKSISAGKSEATYRGKVRINKGATNSENFTQCDSMLIGEKCGAHTFPYIEVENSSSHIGHEASTLKVTDEQLQYFQQRGIDQEVALSTIVNGFCKDVFRELPTEFAVEATQLLNVRLENTVG